MCHNFDYLIAAMQVDIESERIPGCFESKAVDSKKQSNMIKLVNKAKAGIRNMRQVCLP